MADPVEKLDEINSHPGDGSLQPSLSAQDGVPEDPEKLNPEKEYASITRPELSSTTRTASRATSFRSSLGRMRSQNGYGCEDEDDDSEEQVAEPGREKDPFEVGWDGGDNDPMNPRSKNKGMKWVIVVICAVSSFCV